MDADVQEPFKCELCGKSFPKFSYLGGHKLRKHNIRGNHNKQSKGFSCPVCAKVIKGYTPYALKKHLKSHAATEKPNKCGECGKCYKDPKNLKVHHLKVHGEGQKRLKCEFCFQYYSSIRTLEKHVINAHVVDKEFECNICQKSFLTGLNLEQHRKLVHDKKFTCDVCPNTFYLTKSSLLRHLKRSHLRTQLCLLCQKSFSDEEEYQQHMDVDGSAENEPILCSDPGCTLVFGTPCIADQHWWEIHKPVEEASTASRSVPTETRFDCDLCEKWFTTGWYLRSHERHVHPGAVWQCQVCDKRFVKKCNLSAHRKEYHATELKFKCKICSKLYRNEGRLNTHIKTHDTDKPFKCSKCPKSYLQRRQFRIHLISAHGEGEKKYKCPHCPMTFANNYSLEKLHIPTHFDERPFPCESCSLRFKTKARMREHMKSRCRNRVVLCK